MVGPSVGISDMRLYVPAPRIDLETILRRRVEEDPQLERRLRRAIDSTDQVAIRFPHSWEDPVTMAAEAARGLLGDAAIAQSVRYFAVGTETSVDLSKPIASYVHGLLQRSGVALPRELSTFQVQHACAGGTIALTNVAAMLAAVGRTDERGVVVCSDVARYTTPSTAEITQGAGAVAMLVERDPRLLSIDLATIGLASEDVDDFFRPLGSITARVKGRYSVDCYNDALDAAFRDHAARSTVAPKDLLQSTDIFVVHVPFHRMAITGLSKLLEHHLETDLASVHQFLDEKHFGEGIDATRVIGNIYSGSAYMSLMFALYNRFKRIGADIVGQRVMVASYGSGNTMSVYSAQVCQGAVEVLSDWNLDAIVKAGCPVDFGLYEQFVEKETYSLDHGPVATGAELGPELYYLASVRDDGFREYGIRS